MRERLLRMSKYMDIGIDASIKFRLRGGAYVSRGIAALPLLVY